VDSTLFACYIAPEQQAAESRSLHVRYYEILGSTWPNMNRCLQTCVLCCEVKGAGHVAATAVQRRIARVCLYGKG
jgi:hypothetical protein